MTDDYVSESTIDDPPREEQTEMFPKPDEEDRSHSERQFEIDLVLTLKPWGGAKPIRVPLIAGTYAGTRVHEVLSLALGSRRNRKILDAILDNPSEEAAHDGDTEAAAPVEEADVPVKAKRKKRERPPAVLLHEAENPIRDEDIEDAFTPIDEIGREVF